MTASTSISVFHQWLLAEPASKASACAIILHGDDSMVPFSRLTQEIAEYLNEYDDDGDGRWLPATPELVEKIAIDANHRRLLGMDDDSTPPTEADEEEFRKTLTALGQRGHVVFRSPGVPEEELDLANTFHAGVGDARVISTDCHIVLNPDRMDLKCIGHIIGDVFLEWLHCERRRRGPIQDIR